MAVLKLRYQGDNQISQIWRNLLRIVGSQPAQNFDGLYLDVIARILHAIEKHQQILIPGDECVKVRIQASKHGASDIDIRVCCRSHEEFVQ